MTYINCDGSDTQAFNIDGGQEQLFGGNDPIQNLERRQPFITLRKRHVYRLIVLLTCSYLVLMLSVILHTNVDCHPSN